MTITGILNDLNLVSLINCHVTREGQVHKGDRMLFKLHITAQWVVFGSHCLLGQECEVRQVTFDIEHSTTLFTDNESYGSIYSNSEAIKYLANIDNPNSPDFKGDQWSWIGYYTGRKHSGAGALERVLVEGGGAVGGHEGVGARQAAADARGGKGGGL